MLNKGTLQPNWVVLPLPVEWWPFYFVSALNNETTNHQKI